MRLDLDNFTTVQSLSSSMYLISLDIDTSSRTLDAVTQEKEEMDGGWQELRRR